MGNVVNKTLETLAEPSLGNPTTNGMVLSSTTSGVRSWTAISSGGLVNFTEARTTTAPNATKPVHSITATGSDANIDIAIVPKGNGAIVAGIADNAATGGGKRGNGAVDWQMSRYVSTQIASGANSGVLSGSGNTASGIGAVVSGGSDNTASGIYATVSGGSVNTASGTRAVVSGGDSNTATQDYATVLGGNQNKAQSAYSCVTGGLYNTASNQMVFIGGGAQNTAAGQNAVIGGGYGCSASASYTVVANGRYQYTYLLGAAISGGYNTTSSKARQDSKLTMQKTTSDAVAVEIFLDNSSSRAVLKNKCAWAFDVTILAHSSTNVLHTARFKRSGLILRGATAATTTLEGAVQTIGTDIINSNLTGCAVTISADTTNGSLKVEVTGIAATTIIWQAKIELVEIEI